MATYPSFLIKRTPKNLNIKRIRKVLNDPSIHTVCESAKCPNIGECFSRQTLTFMILGKVCTRGCRFCGVKKGLPEQVDPQEPEKIKKASQKLGLDYVVVTSVTRDDLQDGGARQFVKVINELKTISGLKVEVLIPDFQGEKAPLELVLEAQPEVLNHNVESVPRLYPEVRPQADYNRSLELLRYAKRKGGAYIKSGFMVGLGESDREVLKVLHDLKQVGCDMVTIGQYLRPEAEALEVKRFVTPEIFRSYEEEGNKMGLGLVKAGPFVRSSYRAEELWKKRSVF